MNRTIVSALIIATFKSSKDEFLRAQRMAVRHSQLGRLLNRIMPAIGIVILSSGVVSLYQRTTGWPGFLFTVLFGALFFSMPLFAHRTALKLYAQKPDRDMDVTWEISEDGIRSKTELACSENTWAFFHKVIRVRDGFLIYPSGNLFHWLPNHAFRDSAEAERFAELAKSKVKDYNEVI